MTPPWPARATDDDGTVAGRWATIRVATVVVQLPATARLALCILVLGAGLAWAQASPPDVPDVGKGAEEVASQLRAISRSLSDGVAFEALEAETVKTTAQTADRWNETGRLLARRSRTTALDSLESSWRALRNDLESLRDRIEPRVRRREADLANLVALRASWTRSLDLSRAAAAPPPVIERVVGTIEAIDQVRPGIEQRRAKVMVLSDAVSRALQTCDDALDHIRNARHEAVVHLLSRQETPLWRSTPAPDDVEHPTLADNVATNVETLRIYATTHWLGLVASVLVSVVMMGLFRRASGRLQNLVGQEGALRGSAAVLHTPYTAGFLVGLLVSKPFRPNPPFAFQQAVLAMVALAAAVVLRPRLGPRLLGAAWAFAALLVLNLLSEVLELPGRVDQIVLIVLTGATAALLAFAARHFAESGSPGASAPRGRRVARALAHVVILGCVISALAATLGYNDLAEFLGVGLFYGIFLAFGLCAVAVTLDGVVTIALATGPLAQLRTVARHRAVIDRQMRSVLNGSLVLAWVLLALGRFELLEPGRALVDAVLEMRLSVGELDLPVARVLGFGVVVIGVFVITRVVGTLLEEDVYSRMTLPRGVPYALSTLTRYALLLTGFLLALATLGLDLTRITVFVSALGLGLGFGLQQIMNNFVSGLILLFERPIQVGDAIQMDGLVGDVVRIGIRSSTVRTGQGAEVIVPNSKLIEEKVTNWTLSDRRRRVELEVRLKGDPDAQRVLTMLLDVAKGDERVIPRPAPEALVIGLGEGVTEFQLRVWTEDPHWMRLRSDLAVAIQRELRAVDARGEAAGEEPTP